MTGTASSPTPSNGIHKLVVVRDGDAPVVRSRGDHQSAGRQHSARGHVAAVQANRARRHMAEEGAEGNNG